ncbi:steroidogenic acute regulatory protein, mitochondrial [Betta splendens]|uniref:START domain-containing protein 1 n=1 Tax=Betta splendens TaxID=158456 RepID=A0A6P7L3W4_BETSP|nr:steroidogenic acute regulatory protein, mitochondrial [Betta splendens]
MLPAVVKLCCGISYPHLRSMTGLQRTAVAVIGQEITHLQRQNQHHTRMPAGLMYNDATLEAVPVKDDHPSYLQQAREAMIKALRVLKDEDGWEVEITESNGDVICSKMMPGAKRIFRLEAVLEASVDQLHELLFVRVEEMQQWNPSIKQIKVLKRVGPETVITHEILAETAGNLIGQRDFLSVRHSCKQKSGVFLGGAAIHLESLPPQAGYVRAENGPTCIIIQAVDDDPRKSRVTWLLNMDLKGRLPKSIVNQALPRAQLDFIRHLRQRLTATAAPPQQRGR